MRALDGEDRPERAICMPRRMGETRRAGANSRNMWDFDERTVLGGDAHGVAVAGSVLPDAIESQCLR